MTGQHGVSLESGARTLANARPSGVGMAAIDVQPPEKGAPSTPALHSAATAVGPPFRCPLDLADSDLLRNFQLHHRQGQLAHARLAGSLPAPLSSWSPRRCAYATMHPSGVSRDSCIRPSREPTRPTAAILDWPKGGVAWGRQRAPIGQSRAGGTPAPEGHPFGPRLLQHLRSSTRLARQYPK